MSELTVKKIVEERLRAEGFSGLYQIFGECGCEIDDLMPCDGDSSNCIPGHRCEGPAEGCPHRTDDTDCALAREDCSWVVCAYKRDEEPKP